MEVRTISEEEIGGVERFQGNPFQGRSFLLSPTTGNPITMDSVKNIFSPTNVGDDLYRSISNK
jgi:hypothetical protein